MIDIGLAGWISIISFIYIIYQMVSRHHKWKFGRKLLWTIMGALFGVITVIIYLLKGYHKTK